ncbi:MAG: efflux RND transporter periplasmic adaptor subunit [Opitutaceae bacterium]|jgi:RND family efflux transporter MFP subunit|nr:efflux RND transporter periplasmic adaptor subunit [Opitutaceae bacterium]
MRLFTSLRLPALLSASLLGTSLVTPALAQSPAVPVVAVEAKRAIVTESLQLTGTVTARRQASLSSRITGLVQSVAVDAGSYVKAGDALLTLDSTLAELAAQSADADRVAAQTQLSESNRLLEETRSLLKSKSVPETQFLNREAAATMAASAARRAEVAHRQSQELVARHTVVAPFSGVIARKFTEAGEWVSTGAPVLRLVELEGARVDVQIPQERIAAIADDTPVEFTIDSAPDQSIAGRITARVPVSNPDTRTALVRIEPIDTNIALPPGKSVRVIFHPQSDQSVLTVPRDALIRRADGTVTVMIAQPDGDQFTATASRVDLGRTFSDQIEILSGLEPGQHVITRGNETVREGQPVRLLDN